MIKGLEALNYLKHRFEIARTNQTELNIIEQELKEYEKMKAIKGTTTLDSALEQTLINSCPNVAKKLKALEIIENTLDIRLFETTEDNSLGETHYYISIGNVCAYQISKEKYDLLKEVPEK